MKLFQKPISVLLLVVLLSAPFEKVWAQAYTAPLYFNTDSILSFHLSSTAGQNLQYNTAAKLSCFIFLSPDCPLCKNYAALINALRKRYSSNVCFYLVVPGRSYTLREINDFSNGYLKKVAIYRDKKFSLSRYLRATVTPEVVLLESKSGKAVYAGALDNWAVSLGQQRTKATENYLQDAIEGYLHHEVLSITFKEPVGCFINDY